ncbi:MAG: VWA domain-containing protein [Bacillota bacterium]
MRQLIGLAAGLRERLHRGAVRIGEACCASYFVHCIDPSVPEEVRVLPRCDAGGTFYGRANPGEIIHLDIFHDVGLVVPQPLARACREAIARYRGDTGGEVSADLIDIQTGGGGGRITGHLHGGRLESLKRAHMNHVHLACGIGQESLGVLFYLVSAVEDEVSRQGLHIRKVERVRRDIQAQPTPEELSHYRATSDSNLRQGNNTPSPRQVQDIHNLRLALELAEEVDGASNLQHALESFGPGGQAETGSAPVPRDVIETLRVRRLLERDGLTYRLTEEGIALRNFLRTHRKEMEMHLRRIVRRLPRGAVPRACQQGKPCKGQGRRGPGPRAAKAVDGEWAEELAVAETVISSAGRCAERSIIILPEDLWVVHYKSRRYSDICLLLDASASMAGRRIRTGKYLARHLLLKSKGRMAVITFQESRVDIRVPLTRSFDEAERGLGAIVPQGLTPMAQGILAAVKYMKEARARNPLILMITDGIPTVALRTANPVADALASAEEIPEARVDFACVGLEPNRGFLDELARRAEGALYVLEELEKEDLARILQKESSK